MTTMVKTLSDISLTEDKSRLSPFAAPFHPYYEPAHLLVYNDGLPSLVYYSEADRARALHAISDEAIDESFPPTAADAVELEAAEGFVMEMATLAWMEEREERMRSGHVPTQRWESRRRRGLMGRPHPVKGGRSVPPSLHGSTSTALIPFGHRIAKQRRHLLNQGSLKPSHSKVMMRAAPRPAIQQPRKQY